MTLRTNVDKLPIISVGGVVWHPRGGAKARISVDGQAFWVPSVAGVTYNAKIGDNCMGWAADHLEPGVSTRHKDNSHNESYLMLSCVGNEAIVKSGDAKGEKGFVTGKHGGCDHVIIYFPEETLEKLNIDDNIGVKATGQGFALLDYPDIILRNMSPTLLSKMNIKEENGKLKVGVAKMAPAAIMGSGLGSSSSVTGDYDITAFDEGMVKEYGLDQLRFGDIVALVDADNRHGYSYRSGAVSIGVIVHGDSAISGHGPGVCTLMSAKIPVIEPFIDDNANLANYFL
ncbi:MAG: DUF4438 domain-containing protein [Defluviitaleaceae bacterium]|nr:DUF4438 domain-containing protein [Defluviitaleaceae bacterium]